MRTTFTFRLSKSLRILDHKMRGEILSEEFKKYMDEHFALWERLRLQDGALKEGDQVADFMLITTTGEVVRLYDLLKKGPVVISFFRGGWCPYCCVELGCLEERLSMIEEFNATVVGISPQIPEYSMLTQDKNKVSFPLLSDVGNNVAEKFGITCPMSDNLINTLNDELNIKLETINGLGYKESLPVPATFVIDTEGKIVKAHVDHDYSKRLDPDEIIDALMSTSMERK